MLNDEWQLTTEASETAARRIIELYFHSSAQQDSAESPVSFNQVSKLRQCSKAWNALGALCTLELVQEIGRNDERKKQELHQRREDKRLLTMRAAEDETWKSELVDVKKQIAALESDLRSRPLALAIRSKALIAAMPSVSDEINLKRQVIQILSWEEKEHLLLSCFKLRRLRLAGWLIDFPLLGPNVQSQNTLFKLLCSICRDGDCQSLTFLLRRLRRDAAPDWTALRSMLPCGANFQESILEPASAQQHIELIRVLLQETAIRDAADVLLSSVRRGALEVVQVLVENGVNSDQVGGEQCELPLSAACEFSPGHSTSVQDRISLVSFLAERTSDVFVSNTDGVDAFQKAACIPDDVVACGVMDILVNSPSFHWENNRMGKALSCAIKAGNSFTTKMLLDRGALLADEDIATVVASALSTASSTEALLQCWEISSNLNLTFSFAGVEASLIRSPQVVPMCALTPLHWASLNKLEGVQGLLKHNASPLAIAGDGRTVLGMLFDAEMQHGSFTDVLEKLFTRLGSDQIRQFLTTSGRGSLNSPLHQACQHGNEKVLEIVFRQESTTLMRDLLDAVRDCKASASTCCLDDTYLRIFRRCVETHITRQPSESVAEDLLPWLVEASRLLVDGNSGVRLLQCAIRILGVHKNNARSDEPRWQIRTLQAFVSDLVLPDACVECVFDPDFPLPDCVIQSILNACLRNGPNKEQARAAWQRAFDDWFLKSRTPPSDLSSIVSPVTARFKESEVETTLKLQIDVHDRSFRATYDAAATASGRFKFEALSNPRLVLTGKYNNEGLSGNMEMCIPLQSLCRCSDCRHSITQADRRGQGKWDQMPWTWEPIDWRTQVSTSCPWSSRRQLGACLSGLSENASEILWEGPLGLSNLAVRLWEVGRYQVVERLLRFDICDCPPSKALVRLIYTQALRKREKTEILQRLLQLNTFADRARRQTFDENKHMLGHALAQYEAASNETRNVVKQLIEVLCESRVVRNDRNRWRPDAIIDLCMHEGDRARALTSQKLHSILQADSYRVFLRMQNGTDAPILHAIRGGHLELAAQILKAKDAADKQGQDPCQQGLLDPWTDDTILTSLPELNSPQFACLCQRESLRSCKKCDSEVVDNICCNSRCQRSCIRKDGCEHCVDKRRAIRNKVVELVLTRRPLRRDSDKRSPVQLALAYGCLKLASSLTARARAEGHRGLLTDPDENSCTPLLQVVNLRNGETSLRKSVLRDLLSAGAYDRADGRGRTALGIAVKKRDWPAIDMLLRHPNAISSTITQPSAAGQSVLHEMYLAAKENEQLAAKDWLTCALEAGADPLDIVNIVIEGRDLKTLKVLAVWCGTHQKATSELAKALRKFLELSGRAVAGADSLVANLITFEACQQLQRSDLAFLTDVDSSPSRTSPLSAAVMAGLADAVDELLKHNNVSAAIDLQDASGRTALHHACGLQGEVAHRIVRSLLSCRADCSLKTRQGRSALQLAAARGSAENVFQILHKPDAMNRPTSLDGCSRGGHDSEVNSASHDGTTPLLAACGTLRTSFANHTIVRALLDSRADANKANHKSQTPLMLACSSGHEDSIKLLLDGGVSVEHRDWEGKTAIQYLTFPNDVSNATVTRLVSQAFGGIVDGFNPVQAGHMLERLTEMVEACPINPGLLQGQKKRALEDTARELCRSSKRFRHSCVATQYPCYSCSQCRSERSAVGHCFRCFACKHAAHSVRFTFGNAGMGCRKRKASQIAAETPAEGNREAELLVRMREDAVQRRVAPICSSIRSHVRSFNVALLGMHILHDLLPTGEASHWEDSKVFCQTLVRAGIVQIVKEAARIHCASSELVCASFRFLNQLINTQGAACLLAATYCPVQAMEDHREDTEVQLHGLRLLERLLEHAGFQCSDEQKGRIEKLAQAAFTIEQTADAALAVLIRLAQEPQAAQDEGLVPRASVSPSESEAPGENESHTDRDGMQEAPEIDSSNDSDSSGSDESDENDGSETDSICSNCNTSKRHECECEEAECGHKYQALDELCDECDKCMECCDC